MEKIWIREDVDKKQPNLEITEDQVRAKLSGAFVDPDLAIKDATKEHPVFNGFAW